MFVKVVRKEVTEGAFGVSLFECRAVHIRPGETTEDSPKGMTIISLEPDGPEIHIGFDENGKADADVYYMNEAGQTIDKVS
jgi:hypothetical protein